LGQYLPDESQIPSLPKIPQDFGSRVRYVTVSGIQGALFGTVIGSILFYKWRLSILEVPHIASSVVAVKETMIKWFGFFGGIGGFFSTGVALKACWHGVPSRSSEMKSTTKSVQKN